MFSDHFVSHVLFTSASPHFIVAAVYQTSPGFNEACINPTATKSLAPLSTCSAISSNVYSTPALAASVPGTGTVEVHSNSEAIDVIPQINDWPM